MSCVDADRGRCGALLHWGVVAVLALLALVAHDGHRVEMVGSVAPAAASAEGGGGGGDGPGSCHGGRAEPAARVRARHLGSPLSPVTLAQAAATPIRAGPGGAVVTAPAHGAAGWSGSGLLTVLGVART